MPLPSEAFADALVLTAQHLATPIDLPALIASGVLAKVGAWYEVLDRDRLPDHVRAQATRLRMVGQRRLIKFK
jgi:hypothetical protein